MIIRPFLSDHLSNFNQDNHQYHLIHFGISLVYVSITLGTVRSSRTVSTRPDLRADSIASLFLAAGSTRGSSRRTLTTFVLPHVEATRIAILSLAAGFTLGSAPLLRKSFTFSRQGHGVQQQQHSEASMIALFLCAVTSAPSSRRTLATSRLAEEKIPTSAMSLTLCSTLRVCRKSLTTGSSPSFAASIKSKVGDVPHTLSTSVRPSRRGRSLSGCSTRTPS